MSINLLSIRRLLLFSLLLVSALKGGAQIQIPSTEEDLCYARCLIPERIDLNYDTLEMIVYNGSEESIYTAKKEVLVDQFTEHKFSYTTVLDTIAEKRFFIHRQEISTIVHVEPARLSDLKAVVCQDKITPDLIKLISGRLQQIGYLDKQFVVLETMNPVLEDALIRYQRSKKIEEGALDIATLDSMNIPAIFYK